MSEVVKSLPKDHVAHGVFEDVRKWNNTIVCMPTWEEIREVEFVRQSGRINMHDNLQRHCFDLGLFNAVNWLQRCMEARIFWGSYFETEAVMKKFEFEHGPRDTWITEEFRDHVEAYVLDKEEALLEERLRKIRSRRSKRKKKR